MPASTLKGTPFPPVVECYSPSVWKYPSSLQTNKMYNLRCHSTHEPAVSIAGRLSFSQLLFIISYVILESSLPASLGDSRQLNDILNRKKADWEPYIGRESFSDMKSRPWQSLDQGTRQNWAMIRNDLIQWGYIESNISVDALRRCLCRILRRIEQISSQGLNALQPRSESTSPSTIIGEKANLVLIGISLSITLSPVEMDTLLSYTLGPEYVLREMFSRLDESPLFAEGIALCRLRSAMESLGTLLAQEDDSPPSTSEPAIHHHIQGKDSTKQEFEVQSHQTAYMKNSFTYRTNRVTERCTQANIEKEYTELGYEAIKSKASAKFQARNSNGSG